VKVIVVDFVYLGIRNDYEGEVAEGLYAVGEARRQGREGEVCGAEERLCGEGWTPMSARLMLISIALWTQSECCHT
jgi:hypothetical protein